jgi:hypothetical protein
MVNQATNTQSTMQEWLSFRSILNEKLRSEKPLLKKSQDPTRLIYHLAKQFPK